MRTRTFVLLLEALGMAIAAAAIWADRIGLDPSAGWGRLRLALLLLGFGMVLAGALLWHDAELVIKALRRLGLDSPTPRADQLPLSNVRRLEVSGFFAKYWLVIPIAILVIAVYVWIASAGTWTTWATPTRYNADLARSFSRGHLYLPNTDLQPDYSLYRGKAYMYFGPVPALLLLLLRPIISWRVGDLQLVFVFVTATFVVQSLLLIAIRDRYFRTLPKYLLWASTLLAGLAGPATFLLNPYTSGGPHEVPIAGGQFFLLAGFLAVLTAPRASMSRWRLVLAGTAWALAMGTRLILAVPVGFMALMVAERIVSSEHWRLRNIAALLPLGLPLAAGLGGLAWYNWARFGSIFESGLYYQINGLGLDFAKHYRELFNPMYIPQNLYNYFLLPLGTQSQFPYFYLRGGVTQAILPSYPLPSFYFTERLSGLLHTLPFLFFALVPASIKRRNPAEKSPAERHSGSETGTTLKWVTLTLGGACAALSVLLLSYFWAAERFAYEMSSILVVLAAVGFWRGYQALSTSGARRAVYASLGLILAAASIFLSMAVSISLTFLHVDAIDLAVFRI